MMVWNRGLVLLGVLSATLALSACVGGGGSDSTAGGSDGTSAGGAVNTPPQSGSGDAISAEIGMPSEFAKVVDAQGRLTSGYQALCYNNTTDNLSLLDVYYFGDDGEVTFQTWTYQGLNCPASGFSAAYEPFGSRLKLVHQTVAQAQNSQGLPTSILQLDVLMNVYGYWQHTGSESAFMRTYDDGQRLCFGEHEGHYRDQDVEAYPYAYDKFPLATLHGSTRVEGVSERIELGVFDHCLTRFGG
ncbi:MAG: hypothetical protein WCS28_10660 [Thiomicrospira sp.]